MQDACSINHDQLLVAEWFLCDGFNVTVLLVLMIPRISITAFSMSPFDSLSPSTASSVVTAALHTFEKHVSERNDCRFCVTLQRDLTTSKQINELHHPFDCPPFFDSLLQRNAAHDVLGVCLLSLRYKLLFLLRLFEHSQQTSFSYSSSPLQWWVCSTDLRSFVW